MLTATLALTSCSDTWDDHYKSVTNGDGSLWQAMTADGDLSNFTAVLEACGYRDALDGSQVFTVFAPVNSAFTETMRDSVIALYNTQKQKGVKDSRNEAIKEFVKNHVALYNYSVSSLTNDSVVMMNGKYLVLSSNSFGNGQLLRSNVLTSNGILYTVSEVSTYLPNIYEYIGRDSDLDSLANYIYEYSIDVFSPSQSVPGEIRDGKQEYLDSVTYVQNEIMSYWLDADLTDEDSTYWFLAPTNSVWEREIPKYETYFQYDQKVKGRDSLMYNLPRVSLFMGSVFSCNVNPEKSRRDSLLSTNAVPYSRRRLYWGSYDMKYFQFDKPFDEGGALEQTTDVTCSNGVVKKADLWNVKPTQTFMRKLIVEAESYYALDSVYTVSTREPSYYASISTNPLYESVSNHIYAEIAPTSTSNFKALFDIRNVMSNVEYDLYLVAVPAYAGDTLARTLNTKFRATVYYHDMEGKEVNFKTTDAFTTNLYTQSDTVVTYHVDTILIGTYTFPTCSVNLDEAQVKVLLEGRVSSSDVNKGLATKTLNLDCFILKPHEE